MAEGQAVRSEYRQSRWAAIIEECRESGLSNRAFCEQKGINEKTYYNWLRQLRQAKTAAQPPKLVEWSSEKRESVGTNLRLHYDNWAVEIPKGVDKSTLQTALEVLREL